MNKQRLRDMSLGFLLCLALVGSYYCGASGNPTNANASSMGSTEVVVGGFRSEDYFYIAVVDMETGDIKFSEWYYDSEVLDARRKRPWNRD